MAPDGDKVRPSSADSSSLQVLSRELLGNEVSVDGIVYDLDSFEHPGGDQIKVFGGNDVTVHYKMIHPHHSKNLIQNKMKAVARLPQSEHSMEYKFETPFEKELKQRVFQIVRRGHEFATRGFWFRLVGYTTLYMTCLLRWVCLGPSWSLAVVFGMSQAFMGLNVQHDANHGAIAKKYTRINDALGLFADFIGNSKWIWIQQHWTHHAYTNHPTQDPDGTAGEPLLIFDQNSTKSWMHRFQALYFLPLFSTYWLATVPDFNQVLTLQHSGTKKTGMHLDNPFLQNRRKYATLIRIVYLLLHLGIPLYVHAHRWKQVLAQILLMGAAGSLTLAIPFSLSHNFEGAERDPTHTNNSTQGQPVGWYEAQVETSCTYGGRVAGWLTGGLNFQIEHHLFPRMSSAWYPYIAPTVREVCHKHGVRYTYYPTILHNLLSTIRYMHAVGTSKVSTKQD